MQGRGLLRRFTTYVLQNITEFIAVRSINERAYYILHTGRNEL